MFLNRRNKTHPTTQQRGAEGRQVRWQQEMPLPANSAAAIGTKGLPLGMERQTGDSDEVRSPQRSDIMVRSGQIWSSELMWKW